MLVRQLAVMGSPITHSKSPDIHGAVYAELGLDWVYSRIQCDENQFAAKLKSFDNEWRGLSLTMPLKSVAYAASATLDEWAKKSGAVNTLLHKDNLWHGYNTDIPGLALALKQDQVDVTNTVIFGAGSTAESALLAAKSLGADKITVLARRAKAAKELADRHSAKQTINYAGFGEYTGGFAETSAVISSLPGPAGKDLDVPKELFQAHLFDVAYDPWPSPLTSRWQDNGGKTSHGINMLINQALIQMRIFINEDPQKKLPNESELLLIMREAGAVGQ